MTTLCVSGMTYSPDIQPPQTRHRATVVASWNIAPGATILELGCGQGDMTVVLADAVGPEGRVVAADVAAPSYGSPVTLGESAARLAAGPSGLASTSDSAPMSSTHHWTSLKVLSTT